MDDADARQWAIIIMMVALALGGCTPEQDVARCEVEAIRLYPNDPPATPPLGQPGMHNRASLFVIACMRAKGYEYSTAEIKEDCHWGRGNTLATQPGCYKQTDWLARILGRKS
jgi:hypothetical protein